MNSTASESPKKPKKAKKSLATPAAAAPPPAKAPPGVRVLKEGNGVMSDEDRLLRTKKPTAAERKLGGQYRLIHGSIVLPVPESERLLPDGTLNPNVQTVRYVQAGAEIELDDEEAARLEDAGLIEPLSVSPRHSRLGKVWSPPVNQRM
jgi:hypothetical protein